MRLQQRRLVQDRHRGTIRHHLPAGHLGLTVADAQRLFGHSKVMIRLWLTRAREHAEKVHIHFFQNLFGHVQLDELP